MKMGVRNLVIAFTSVLLTIIAIAPAQQAFAQSSIWTDREESEWQYTTNFKQFVVGSYNYCKQ